jgi:Fe-S cluster assembly protein SufB
MNYDYKYGFNDGDIGLIKIEKGISEDKIKEISKIKNEPEWMLEYRLKAYKKFIELRSPNWEKLEQIDFNFDDIFYYIKPSKEVSSSWDQVPEKIKNTFDKLGIK